MQIFLLLILAWFLSAPSFQEPEPYQISVNVHLVVVHATVHDSKGRVASDLIKQDFALYEDGVLQSLRLFQHEDVPVTVGLVIDHSGSMRAKIADVVAAGRAFAQSSNPQDQMFVVNFNEKVTLGLPSSMQFTSQASELTRAIENTPTIGQTALYDAFIEARHRLASGKWDKKVLIVISDGGDNRSRHSFADALRIAGESGALVYSIGIFDPQDQDRNPKVLKRLAEITGGEAFFPDRYDKVVEDCQHIAREIRHQYTLGYISSNTKASKESRAIRVVAKAGGKGKLSVRARSGYVAVEESRLGK